MAFTLTRRHFAAGAALLPVACSKAHKVALGDTSSDSPSGSSSAKVTPAPDIINPVVKNRADAQVYLDKQGNYYITGSVPKYDRLVLRRARSLEGLHTAEERVLWRHADSGPLSGFIWAPELHLVDDKWTMYFAAGPSGGGADVFRIRTYAIVCDGPDPMTGNWSLLGEFKAPWDSFNLDSTSFMHRGTRYFCWAEREPGIDTNSNLYLAPMASPLTLSEKPVRLSVPTLPWEIRGYKVNEAPSFLEHEGRVFISYSASATDSRYCLGLLWAKADADLMDKASWTKSQQPVFTSCPETGVYGPGHNSFTVDREGRTMLVYHGRDYKKIEGDPLFDPNRHTRIQRLYFKPDGMPDFGVPVGNGRMPERFISTTGSNGLLSHDGTTLSLRASGSVPLAQTQFRSIEGKDGTVQLSPILLRGSVLAAGTGGAVDIVPEAEAAKREGSARFRRTAGSAPGTIRFVCDGHETLALAVKGDTITLASADSPEAQWKPD